MTNQRNIKFIVLHCTATQPFATVESIQRYWREVKKWKSPGYHYIISANGGVKQLADENQATNGVLGHNHECIHISYIGGVDKGGKPADTRTPEQLEAMKRLVMKLRAKYPTAKIQGHRDFGVKKACPSFDVADWLRKSLLLMCLLLPILAHSQLKDTINGKAVFIHRNKVLCRKVKLVRERELGVLVLTDNGQFIESKRVIGLIFKGKLIESRAIIKTIILAH